MKQSEVRNLFWREFDWLMAGIDIDQLKPSKQSKKHLDSNKNPAQKNPKIPCRFGTFQESFPFSKSYAFVTIKVSNPRRDTMASSAKDIKL